MCTKAEKSESRSLTKKEEKPLSGTSVPIKQERRKTTPSSLRPSVGCPSLLTPMHVLVRITNEQMSAIKTTCHHYSFNLLDSSDLFSFSFSDKSLRFAKAVCLYRTKNKKKRKETHTQRRLKSFNNKYIPKNQSS